MRKLLTAVQISLSFLSGDQKWVSASEVGAEALGNSIAKGKGPHGIQSHQCYMKVKVILQYLYRQNIAIADSTRQLILIDTLPSYFSLGFASTNINYFG